MKGNLYCPHRSIEDVNEEHLKRIQELENMVGFELEWSSGCRCPECNALTGGAKYSAHKRESHKSNKACASDIRCTTSRERYKIVKEALNMGFKRIEVRSTWIHLDSALPDDGFAQEVMF